MNNKSKNNTGKPVTNKKKKNKVKKPNNRNPRMELVPKLKFRLSDCASQYMLALTHPSRAQSPCIPDFVSLPSLKYTVVNRGSFGVGVGVGHGYIMVNPTALAFNDGIPLGAGVPAAGAYPPGIIATNGTYAVSGYQFQYGAGLVTSGIDQVSGNSPFSRVALQGAGAVNAPLVKLRLVGASIEIAYEGTQLDLSGKVISCFSRGSDNVAVTGFSISSGVFLRDRSTNFVSESSARKVHFVNFLPSDSEWDLSYKTLNERLDPYVGSSSLTRRSHDGYSLFLGVSCPTTVAPTYSYTVTAHYEAIGPILPTYGANFGASMTQSESDPSGLSAVLNGVNKVLSSATDTVINDPASFAKKVHNVATSASMLAQTMSYFYGSSTPTIQGATITEL